MNAVWFYVACFLLGACGGWGAVLRTPVAVRRQSSASAMLNNGLLALAIVLGSEEFWSISPQLSLALCILTGLGGASLTELFFYVLRGQGIVIRISPGEDEEHISKSKKKELPDDTTEE